MKKRVHFGIRMTQDEKSQMKNVFKHADYEGTMSSYYRDIMFGRIPHPFLEDSLDYQHLKNDDEDSTKVIGPEQTEKHYLAVVIAAFMLRIKLDPDFHKYRKAEPVMFQKLIDQIRGYEYDEKSQVKIPLDRPGRK